MSIANRRGIPALRALAVLAAAAMAFAVLPLAGVGLAQDATDPCPDDVPPAPFTDRASISTAHRANVDCAAANDMVSGFGDNTYRPRLQVRRDQMASFIARTLVAAGVELPAPDPVPFTDVLPTNPHFENIQRLKAADIIAGAPSGLPATAYGPSLRTRRDQMASFLIRAAEFATEADLGSTTARFSDVPPGNTHFANVNAAAELGLAQGTTATQFAPAQATLRDQMASFVVRLLGYLLDEGAGPSVSVAVSPTSGPAGTDVTATVTGDLDELDTLAMSGACVEDNADVTVDAEGEFTFGIAADADAGACTITFTATFDDESTQETTASFEVVAPVSNQTFAADVEGRQILEFDDAGTGQATTRAVFEGLDNDEDYHVALFQNVNGTEGEIETVDDDGGFITFRDKQDSDPTAPFDGFADYECTSYNGAQIVSVNGAGIASQCAYDVSPVGGVLDIVLVNAANTSDAVWLVVWQDADDDDELNLDEDNAPSEDFGVVGPIIWHGGEAPTGSTDLNGEYVLYVDHEEEWFVSADTWMYVWDSTDDYNYDQDYNITFDDFSAWLNANDYLYNEDVDGNTVAYSRNRAAENAFSLYDEGPNAPSNVAVVVGDLDDAAGDTAENDVMLSWDHDPTRANMDDDAGQSAGYCWYRYAADDVAAGSVAGGCWTWGDNTPESDAAIVDREGLVADVPAGDWVFTVSAYSADNFESDESEPSAAVTAEVASGAPISESTLTADADLSATVTTGDVLTVNFDQAMDTTLGAQSITLRDNDGTTCSFTHTVNATFAFPDADTMTVNITGAPDCTAAGTAGGLQYPAEVTASAGIVDADQGLGWNITGSTDVTFE